jgi:predicted AAA+ superfamily ATPase
MYIRRHIENALNKVVGMYPAVIVTGARQVGKTTLVKECSVGIKYVTLDDVRVRELAETDPAIFFKTYEPPLILDEVQYAPKLFSGIKTIADETRKSGMFYMTGSQSFHLMKNVTESLAGRVGILELKGLSYREIMDIKYDRPFLPTTEHVKNIEKEAGKLDYWNMWGVIQKGSFPKIYENEYDAEKREVFFNDYLRTYLERDVRALTQVADERAFLSFMTASAALTGQQLNYETLARAAGKDVNTIKRWLSILITSGLVYLLEPYNDNVLKRMAKTPKLHFMDTGLACFLCGWNTPKQLESGAMAGAMFETFAVSEIIKSFSNAGIDPRLSLFYYKDGEKREIDLVIKRGGVLYPVEIKKTGGGVKKDIAAFELLKKSSFETGEGGLICMDETKAFLTETDRIIPVNMI